MSANLSRQACKTIATMFLPFRLPCRSTHKSGGIICSGYHSGNLIRSGSNRANKTAYPNCSWPSARVPNNALLMLG